MFTLLPARLAAKSKVRTRARSGRDVVFFGRVCKGLYSLDGRRGLCDDSSHFSRVQNAHLGRANLLSDATGLEL